MSSSAASVRSPRSPRRRLGPDERRAQLVQLGVELIRERPFDQVLVDAVIAAAGISKGLLFHYFPSKRDFQVAVVRAAADELLASLEPDPTLDQFDQLRNGIATYVGYIEENQSTYTAIVRGAGSDQALLQVFEDTRDAIVELIVGRMLDDPPPLLRLAVRGWIASVEEATFLWLRDRPCTRDQLIGLLFTAALQLLPIVERASSS